MRLYRGLSRKYRPAKVGEGRSGRIYGTDFTDSPYAALQFGSSSRGVVLVLDLPSRGNEAFEAVNGKRLRVTEELWHALGSGPARYMVWGGFDDRLIAEIPAKELRAQIRGEDLGLCRLRTSR